jgi:hypothetical protein
LQYCVLHRGDYGGEGGAMNLIKKNNENMVSYAEETPAAQGLEEPF